MNINCNTKNNAINVSFVSWLTVLIVTINSTSPTSYYVVLLLKIVRYQVRGTRYVAESCVDEPDWRFSGSTRGV